MQRRPRLSWGHTTFQLTLGLVLCLGSLCLLALDKVCCDQVDRFFARVVIPSTGVLSLVAVVNYILNNASVVYDRERISMATWFGRYRVKSLRWQDVVHVQAVVYRRGYRATVIRLYGPGTRIDVCPEFHANGAEFHAELMRHLEHVLPSEQSTSFRGA